MLFNSCQDVPPNDYIKRYYVEGYLYVNQPIKGIKVMFTQTVSDSFKYENSFIKDAEVIIKTSDKSYVLNYDFEKKTGYYLNDTSINVTPSTNYTLEVRLKDGSFLTATTTTPNTTKWVKGLPDLVYYPKDTLKLAAVDSLQLTWERVPGTIVYLISTKCTDTTEYGLYLDPPRDEKNRRIVRPWERAGQEYNETTRWGFIPNNTTPVVWNTLKWFGKNTLRVYVPDEFFLKYFIQYQRSSAYDPKLTNIKGDGFGIFASAFYLEKEFILIKNQP